MKVVVAMSGGVDSSVAAYLLKREGFDVIGLSFELWDRRDIPGSPNTCCSIETVEIAKAVARKLGIDHYTVDVRDAFYRYVIENFCTSYIGGATPNPCILCNRYIKFDFLIDKAIEVGADIIATGHYARVEAPGHRVHNSGPGAYKGSKDDRILLKKGVDHRKDQSYALYVMTQEELSRVVFPLGEMTKDKTREIAKGLGLVSALRPESQEICFVGEGDYTAFIRDFASEALQPGPIINTMGEVIGEHKGIAFYTIGQRKRLGIHSPRPSYVVDIDHQRNTIVVGSREEAMKKAFRVRDLNWISIESLSYPIKVKVKVRSTMREEPAMIIPEGDAVMVRFDEPQWAPARGQSAVFYDGDVVIGGGIIEMP
jgi:tRNA-specific 2-thiouridylase